MFYDLEKTINQLPNILSDPYDLIPLPNAFLSPSFWVAFVAKCVSDNVDYNQIFFRSHDQEQYAKAIKLERAFDRVDSYPHERVNCGINYSPITALRDENLTDAANEDINGCLRHICEAETHLLNEFCSVVGELHDNVWSHGMSIGFSMAQKYKVPHEDDHYVEFSLADRGLGFKAEMEKERKCVDSHMEAIQWCIKEGNSTKLPSKDDFAQWQPEDMLGPSNYGPDVAVNRVRDGNNHQGLGLAKLVSLVRKSSAELQIVSGDCLFKISEDGLEDYYATNCYWKGVAVSCKLRASRLSLVEDPNEKDIKQINSIVNRLKGVKGERS